MSLHTDSDMDNTSENSNTINEEKKIYVYYGSNSRWVSEKHVTNFPVQDAFAAYADISYKFSRNSNLSPNRFSFVEFILDEDAKKSLKDARDSENDNNDKKEKFETEKEEEEIGPVLIDKLSFDCLIEIFLYLPLEKRLEMEDVCVRWRDVSKKAWSDVRELEVNGSLKLERSEGNIRSKFIEKLLMRCGAYLRTLKLRYICSSEILLLIGKYCHNLTTIEVKFIECDDKDFITLPKLEKLQSFMMAANGSCCFPPVMNSLRSLPKTIKSIQIGDFRLVLFDIVNNFRQSKIANVFEEFSALNSLTIGTHGLQTDVIEGISKVETITKLGLPFCKIKEGLNMLTNMSGLEYLNLHSVYEINNNFLAELSTKCKKLKYLNVSYCRKLSDEGIMKLKNLDNLKVLLMHGMDDSVTDFSLGQLKGIRRLECRKCWEVGDDGIIELMRNCPELEKLNVRLTSISEETLQFAIILTKYRKNSVILHLNADIEDAHEMNLDVESEDYSPFLIINDPNSEMTLNYPDDEDDYDHDSENEEYYNKNAYHFDSDSE